jgi:hypothetical protein
MRKYLLALTLVCLAGCIDERTPVPPDIPIERLLSAPDTILVQGRYLTLATALWRDFMPVSPPEGKPLIAVISVTATDTTPLPPSITADAVWIVYEDQVWKSWLANPGTPEQRPNQIVRVARDGPTWGPNVFVDVIVRILDGEGTGQLLRASNQPIHRTD